MKRYWDLTEEERAALTRDEVEAFTRVEMMEKGVVEPTRPPKMEDAPRMPEIETTTWFSVGDVLFGSYEQAAAFIKLNPHKEGYNYQIGYEVKYPDEFSPLIQPRSLYSKEAVHANRDILSKVNAFKEKCRVSDSEYDKAIEQAQSAVASVWSDYLECKKIAAHRDQLRRTFDDYKKMCDGNERIALGFLKKAYVITDIQAALPHLFEEEAVASSEAAANG